MNRSLLLAAAPLLVLAAGVTLQLLALVFFRRERFIHRLTLAALLSALAGQAAGLRLQWHHVDHLLQFDALSYFFGALVLLLTLGVTFLVPSWLRRFAQDREEYYILLLLGAFGAALLPACRHFASFIPALEIVSVSLYGLLGYEGRGRNLEAAMKYLILASFSASFLFFGAALLYGDTGSLSLDGLFLAGGRSLLFQVGLAMVWIGLGFKLAVAPFHLWTPDVYQGAPTPSTIFLAAVSKGAVAAFLLRVLPVSAPLPVVLRWLLYGIAVLSMFWGNWCALLQQNVKRILAYSSIAHLGYLLAAFVVGGRHAGQAILFYICAYTVSVLGAFAVVSHISPEENDETDLTAYRGLFRRRPLAAFLFAFFLFSLAGIPLTGGFLAKFLLLRAGTGASFWVLMALVALNSVVGIFYYLRILLTMTAEEPDANATAVPTPAPGVLLTLAAAAALILWLGVAPSPALHWFQSLLTP